MVPPSGSGSVPVAWTCVMVSPRFGMFEHPAPPAPAGVLPPVPKMPMLLGGLSPHPGPAIASKRTAAPSDDERRSIERHLWANMALNAGWCWLFFTAEKPKAALAEIIALEASTLVLLKQVRDQDAAAHAALAPYAVWNGFATALNAAIARRN